MAARELGRILELKKPDGTPVIPFDTAAGYNVGVAFRTTEAEVARATDPIKDGVSKVAVDPKKVSSAAAKKLPALTRNPMEDFATSTILWTLAALTPAQFNNPASYRNSPQELQNVVFSSGGRFDNQRVNTLFGAPEYFVAVVKPGRIMFEVGGVPAHVAKEALRLAAQKLPVKTKLIVARDFDNA